MARSSDAFVTYLFDDENNCLGEVVASPQTADAYLGYLFGKEIRIASFSVPSERCLPLLVLHTIASGVWFKLEPSEQQLSKDVHRLNNLHSSCLKEAKTAVVSLEGGHELHLVAMPPSQTQIEQGGAEACFWGFITDEGMYASCLAMLNLRCLAMVLDLDETLIVANTMKTFDDRIDALSRRLNGRDDPQLMGALKRFQEDKAILEQYYKTDQVFDNGKLYKAQSEVVAPVADGALPIVRPIIRLQERNLILTRINPAVRDTSVLVRLRPAWEELRSYVIAKGRKRFEVFICTMSERDYALEMWRLLDPESRLIHPRELNERVNCVKSDAKKSLKDVFPRRCCHPKMAMVIDDRLPVWEKVDQPRVHEVQAFQPYSDPKAETIRDPPPLCIARNIACNVRGGFFKELDENLAQQIADARFDTDISTLPKAPDVSSYLLPEVILEDVVPNFATNGTKDITDSMANMEEDEANLQPQGTNGLVHPRMFPMDEDLRLSLRPPFQQAGQPTSHIPTPTVRSRMFALDIGQGDMPSYSNSAESGYYSLPAPVLQRPLSAVSSRMPEAGIQGSPAREEGEVPETDIDPDTRRRLLILQHGQDTLHGRDKDSDFTGVQLPSLQVQIPVVVAPAGGWLGTEEEMSPRRPTRSPELILEPESPSFESRQRVQGPPGFTDGPFVGERAPRDPRRRRPQEEVFFAEKRQRLDPSALSDDEEVASAGHIGGQREHHLHAPPRLGVNINAISYLHEIGQKVKVPVHYRTVLRTSSQLGFNVEISFGGDKVGEGTGRTKKEAKYNAAEAALRYLARNPSAGLGSEPTSIAYPGPGEEDRVLGRSPRDPSLSAGIGSVAMDGDTPIASTSGHDPFGEYRPVKEPSYNPVTALKDLCTMQGINVQWKALPSSGIGYRRTLHCQAEVGGRILGKGSGPLWDTAKHQAAEEALQVLQSSLHSHSHKRSSGPRARRSTSHMGRAEQRRSSRERNRRLRAGELLKDQGLSLSGPTRQ